MTRIAVLSIFLFSAVALATDNTRFHSKLWNYGDKKLEDVDPGQDRVIEITDAVGKGDSDNIPCRAEVVVIGTVRSIEVHRNEKGTFLYTDAVFHVDKILRGRISEDTNIFLTRPGGELVLSGRKVTTALSGVASLTTSDRYLLYLIQVPETGAYRPAPPEDFSTYKFQDIHGQQSFVDPAGSKRSKTLEQASKEIELCK